MTLRVPLQPQMIGVSPQPPCSKSPFGTTFTGPCAVTAKESVLVPVPAGVVTLIGPLVRPLGTRAWILESESSV